jgi:hypothetical protein
MCFHKRIILDYYLLCKQIHTLISRLEAINIVELTIFAKIWLANIYHKNIENENNYQYNESECIDDNE